MNSFGNNDELSQGTSYDEEEFDAPQGGGRIRGPLRANNPREIAEEDDSDTNEEEDDYEEPESIMDKIKQNPIIVIAIVVVIAIILIGIVLLTTSSNSESENSDSEDTETVEDVNSLSEDELLAEMQALQGQSNEVSDQVEDEDRFTYSDEDRKAMVAWGLSIEEIEEKEKDEIPPAEAIKEARDMLMTNRAEVYKALLRNATDNPDEAYHYVLGNSIFGLPIQPEDKNEQAETYYSETELVDFRKIPLQGYQAMIRVVVPNTDYVFYVTIPYVKYLELPDQGNCRLKWDVTEKNGIVMFTNFTLID